MRSTGPCLRGDRRERREDAVRDVAGHDLERGLAPSKRARAPAREVRALAGAKVVEHDDAMARRDQRVDGVRADETGAAGDHGERLVTIEPCRTRTRAVLPST